MTPQVRFEEIDRSLADQIAQRFGSPVYLMDESLLFCRFDEMQKATRAEYDRAEVAVSYKTNPTRSLLDRLHRRGALAEVVSGDEYQIAISLGVSTEKIIFNGPAKSDEVIETALLGNSYLHCDHEDEVVRVEKIAQRLKVVAKIGVRLYFPADDSWERFGFWADAADESCQAFAIARRISDSGSLRLAGLHAHIGTNIRDLKKFGKFATVFAQFLEKLREQLVIEPEWIDLGGGLAGTAPSVVEDRVTPHRLPSLRDYCRAIVLPLLPFLHSCAIRPRLFFEPGRTIFNAAGALFATVVGRRPADSSGIESIILDAGITSLALAYKYDYPVHVCKNSSSPTKRVRLLGPTCMEQDVVTRPVELPELEPGDRLLIYGTGCYSMALASSFTHFRLGIVGWGDGQQLRWLRKPETLEHSQRLDVLDVVDHLSQSEAERRRSSSGV